MAKKKINQTGTMTISLGGKDFRLRPSFSSLSEFEETSGVGAYEALSGLQGNKINTKIVVSAIWAGIRGAKPGREETCPTYLEIGEMCFSKGMMNCIPDALKFLTIGLAGAEAAEEILSDEGKPLPDSSGEED